MENKFIIYISNYNNESFDSVERKYACGMKAAYRCAYEIMLELFDLSDDLGDLDEDQVNGFQKLFDLKDQGKHKEALYQFDCLMNCSINIEPFTLPQFSLIENCSSVNLRTTWSDDFQLEDDEEDDNGFELIEEAVVRSAC